MVIAWIYLSGEAFENYILELYVFLVCSKNNGGRGRSKENFLKEFISLMCKKFKCTLTSGYNVNKLKCF